MGEIAWQQQWERVVDKWSTQGYDALTFEEQVWLNLRALIDATNNGGLIAYYANNGAEYVYDCMEALHRLGAPKVLSQIERLNALFGKAVPVDLEERNEIILSWEDKGIDVEPLLEEIDEILYAEFDSLEARLEAFLRKAGLVD